MKFSLKELKMAFDWIEANTRQTDVKLDLIERVLKIRTFDKYDDEVVITLFSNGVGMAKLTKTERLK